MRKLLCSLGCLLLAFALASPAMAAGDLAQTIKDCYVAIDTFQADFTQYLTRSENGKKEKRVGVMRFKRPLLISWKTQSPSPETLLVTNAEIWDYFPDEKVAYRYARSLVEDSRTLIQVVTGQALLSKDFDVKEQGMEGKLKILRLYPKEPVPQMTEAVIYVDPDRGYILRAVITDFYGNTNDVRFTSFTPNPSLSSSEFKFKAPKGCEVEDRTKDAGAGRTPFN